MSEEIPGDAAAGDGGVKAPGAWPALGYFGIDRPILEEFSTVVENFPKAAFIDQLFG